MKAKRSQTNEKNKEPDYIGHTCGECAIGQFDYSQINIDMNGKPICLTCPYHKFKRIRSAKACDKWKARRK